MHLILMTLRYLLVHTGVPSLQNLCISTVSAGENLLTSSHPTIPPTLWQHIVDLQSAQQKHTLVKPKQAHKILIIAA
jgi:hypothetical protein